MRRGAKDGIQFISPDQLKKIEQLSNDKGVKFIHIANKMGFTRSQMSMVKSGKRYLSSEEREKLDKILSLM